MSASMVCSIGVGFEIGETGKADVADGVEDRSERRLCLRPDNLGCPSGESGKSAFCRDSEFRLTDIETVLVEFPTS